MRLRSTQSGLPAQAGFGELNPNLQRLLKRYSLREWRVRNTRLDRAVEDTGSLFVFPEETFRNSRAFAFDPVPFSIDVDSWHKIQSGVLQRARMMNAFLKDLYSERRILEAGILPPDWVLDDPSFELEYSGLCGNEDPALFGALDLICTASGDWLVSDHHFSVPEGLSHLIQGRRLLAQYFPEYATDLAVEPVASFPSRISESLRLAPMAGLGSEEPLAVMLARNDRKEIFLEESFLARQMGMPVVMPTDLVVRDFQVYFKTIHGLLPVSVIFRRVPSEGLDPVAVKRHELAGVPGLIHCLRAGTVRMVNAPGTGIADNRSLLRYTSKMTTFYLNEKRGLKDLPTLVSYDPDQALEFRDNPESWWIRPALKPHLIRRWTEQHPAAASPSPEVAHPRMDLRSVQIWNGKAFESRVFSLRVFFVLGQDPVVLPGGWLRLTRDVPLDQVGDNTWDYTQDVSVAINGKHPTLPRQRLEQSLDTTEIPPGSTLAESMYWLGRYLERADSGARMVSILAEESFAQGRDDNWISWESFIAVVGEDSRAAFEPWRREPDRFAALMLFRSDLSPSVWSCLEKARQMADSTLGNLSPEFSQILGELRQRLRPFVSRKRLTPPERRSCCLDVMQTVGSLFGTADRTLLLDESWRLMCIGSLLERAILTVNMLSKALPLAARHQSLHRIDDSELVYLLRMTGTLDAYHRIYRSRAFIDRVARLLWQHPRAPRSVQYCLNEVLRHLQALSAAGGSTPKGAIDRLLRLSKHVQTFPVAQMFPARSLELDWGLPEDLEVLASADSAIEEASQHLRREIEAVHHRLEADFFNHEAHQSLGRIQSDAF
ncbi:MAG: circularly permuted type 2 ATP-grasp protein [Opitutales bacterium]|nr:circularly permuted type 2 ATP-grasp protein [Opitutales bacterium]